MFDSETHISGCARTSPALRPMLARPPVFGMLNNLPPPLPKPPHPGPPLYCIHTVRTTPCKGRVNGAARVLRMRIPLVGDSSCSGSRSIVGVMHATVQRLRRHGGPLLWPPSPQESQAVRVFDGPSPRKPHRPSNKSGFLQDPCRALTPYQQ
jgi:hypothetical protein